MAHGLAATTLGVETTPENPALAPHVFRAPPARGSRGRGGAATPLSPVVEGSEVADGSPFHIPDGVCKVCVGMQVIVTELSHTCTNCSGRGYSTSDRRSKCSFCSGAGQVSYTAERTCEACGGTGKSRSLSDSVAAELDREPVLLVEHERGKSANMVGRDSLLTAPCLLNCLGLLLAMVGSLFLVADQLTVAGVGITLGALVSAATAGLRVRRLGAAKKEHVYAPSCEACEPQERNEEEVACRKTSHIDEATAPLTYDQLVMVATIAVLPNACLLLVFSDMGIGVEVYSAAAAQHMNLTGELLLYIAAFLAGALAVFDWLQWPRMRQAASASVPLGLTAAGTVLKGWKYPWAPLLLVLLCIPFGLGFLRSHSCRLVRRRSFYKAVGLTLTACSVALLASWLCWIGMGGHAWDDITRTRLAGEGSALFQYSYSKHALSFERHCGRDRDLSELARADRQDVKSACAIASTALFLSYASPFVAACCNGIMAMFCFLQRAVPSARDVGRTAQVTQIFLTCVVAGVAVLYASVYLSSASFRLGSMLCAFLAAGFAAVLAWGFMEIDRECAAELATTSECARILRGVWSSDWSKAVVVGGFNILLPAGFFMSWLTMKVRRRRGVADSEARFTPSAERILEELRRWDWVSVLSKICILGELFFTLQVGVAKVTYVFLSWLNASLASMDFGLVVLLVILIGYTMFLLPPVPGVPVYVFAGVVVSERGRLTPGVGYVGGVLISVAISFAMKLVACVSQYMIGFHLGKSVRIQQLIGVDKVITRAVERIIKEPGLSKGKVAILVGGPDWPTSVICGILRVNVPQMVWGTCPVIFVIAPCVLAGSFLSRVRPGEDSIWALLSDTAIGVAAVVNGASTLYAFYKTAQVARRHEEELSVPRPEHEQVVELTRHDRARREAYAAVTKWDGLSIHWKVFLSAAAVMHLACGFVFGLLSSACFRNFSVGGRIDDEIPDGLSGDPFKIVREPYGWLPIGIFLVAAMMHAIFIGCMDRMAVARLRAGGPGESADGPGESKPVDDEPHPPFRGEPTDL